MTRPSFILITIDDLGWRDLGCTGSEFYETPNIDRLAAEGVRFENAYATCPVCSPSRASALTGKYPARLGLTNYIGGNARGRLIEAPYVDHLALEERSLPRALAAAGYATWHVGKWHLGARDYWPDRHGFEVNVGGCDWGMPHNGYFSPWGNPTLPDGPEGQYLTDRLTDEAINLIRTAGDRPFFLNLCYYAVHVPIEAKAHLVARFRKKAEGLGLDRLKTFEVGGAFPCERKRYLRVMRRLLQSDPAYAAMIYTLDENVGRLLEALQGAGRAGSTAVFFTSDNGGLATAESSPTCNLPLAEGKGWTYEGGTRVALLARTPGAAAPGGVCSAPVIGTDFYPTMLEIAGLDPLPEQHCDGVSLAPLLAGRGSPGREALFWHYPHYGNQGGAPASAVRAGDWKLIEHFEDGRRELYDLAEDPGEERDLAAESPGRAAELGERLRAWRAEVGALVPEPNPDWKGQA